MNWVIVVEWQKLERFTCGHPETCRQLRACMLEVSVDSVANLPIGQRKAALASILSYGNREALQCDNFHSLRKVLKDKKIA